jgi:hypothetical protein
MMSVSNKLFHSTFCDTKKKKGSIVGVETRQTSWFDRFELRTIDRRRSVAVSRATASRSHAAANNCNVAVIVSLHDGLSLFVCVDIECTLPSTNAQPTRATLSDDVDFAALATAAHGFVASDVFNATVSHRKTFIHIDNLMFVSSYVFS